MDCIYRRLLAHLAHVAATLLSVFNDRFDLTLVAIVQLSVISDPKLYSYLCNKQLQLLGGCPPNLVDFFCWPGFGQPYPAP